MKILHPSQISTLSGLPTDFRSLLHRSRFTNHISCLRITLLPALFLFTFLVYHIQREKNIVSNTFLDFFPRVSNPLAPLSPLAPLIYSEFSTSQKYLQWLSKNDVGAGVKHRFHSWGCALGEAVALNRTFLFPTRFKVIPPHNHGRPEIEKDIRHYIDVALLHRPTTVPFNSHSLPSLLGGRQVPLIAEDHFWEQWEKYRIESRGVGTTLSHQKTDGKNRTSVLRDTGEDRFLVMRSFGWSYAYSRCYDDAFKTKGLDWEQRIDSEYTAITLPYAAALVKIGASIKRLLGPNYIVVHVQRGDRIGPSHPTLDHDTQPAQLRKTIPKWVPRGSAIYLATNEDAPHFFDSLGDMYVISSIADYRNLWIEGSGWWNESSHLFSKNDSAPFDGMMEGIVDYMVMGGASTFVDTFGMFFPGNSLETTAIDLAAWDFGASKSTKTLT